LCSFLTTFESEKTLTQSIKPCRSPSFLAEEINNKIIQSLVFVKYLPSQPVTYVAGPNWT
jgi:hypothetical protein